MNVSVIVPIYNVEKFIEKCVVSLLEQTSDSIEYIFVNDSTNDNSIEILKEIINQYPKRKPYCRIIHHERNKGLGSARKTGIENATGEYIIHIDSDDWCKLDLVEKLYQRAQESKADIIYCDYFLGFLNKKLYAKQINCSCSSDFFKKILRDEISASLCNKLVKRNLYNNVEFASFNLGEDFYVSLQLAYNASSVSYLPESFYYYRQCNQDSITKNKQTKIKNDFCLYYKKIEELLKKWDISEELEFDYLAGLVSRALTIIDGRSIPQILNKVSPKLKQLKCLWSLKNKTIIKKLAYSLTLFHLGFLTNFLKRLKL